MPSQKLLPYFFGGTHSPYFVQSVAVNEDMLGVGIGPTITITHNSDDHIPYIRKSISSPDNTSYLSINSGILPRTSVTYDIYHQYDIPGIYVESLTSRFICSGLGNIAPWSDDIQYYVSKRPDLGGGNFNDDYMLFAKANSYNTSYIGDPASEFSVFTVETIDDFPKELVNNLLSSGNHIFVTYTFDIYNGFGPLVIDTPAFSAFEIEVSGHLSKSLPLYISGPTLNTGNISLFITGNYPTNYLDLYVNGVTSANNNISLVVDGFFPSGTLNLFTQADTVPTSGINLYLENHSPISGNNSINLHAVSSTAISGDINLYMEGGGYGVDNDYINLFMYSKQPSGNLTLYTENHLASGNKSLNLYTISYLSDSGELPLHINGGGIDLRQNELTLFTRSAIENSGDVNLSIIGNIATGPINFYIKAEDVAKSSGLTDFYIFSALNSGIYNSFDIVTKAGGHEASLPIYMPVESTGSQTSNINMVLLNDTTNNKDVLLYIENNTQSKSGSYTLFTQGNGTLNGGSVYSSSIDMFINRSDESLSSVVPMTIMGPSGITNTVPFVIKGGTISESGITLNMPSTASVYVNQFDIMTHGF